MGEGTAGGGERRRDDGGQFKEPVGQRPEVISKEYSSIMAKNWVEDIRLFVKVCSNLEILSPAEQKTICKRFVEETLA